MHSLQTVLPVDQAQPLFQAAACRALEARAAQDLPPHTLMQRAGAALAKLALALSPHGQRLFIACGPGNNGGDGLVAARLLQAAGKHVEVLLLDGGRPAPPDAAWALAAAREAGVAISDALPARIEADLVLDALLGLGLTRAPEERLAEAVARINAQHAPVLAVDLPSGLASDSGRVWSGCAVNAMHTLALLALKPGLFTAAGRGHCGRIWFDALGVDPALIDQAPDALLGGGALLRLWQTGSGARGHASHKGSHGDVLVVGGAPGMRGAARLAARAALAAGAGRVHACLLQAESGLMDTLDRPELMSWAESRLHDQTAWRDHVVVAGCGGGSAVASVLPGLLADAGRLVLDADALNVIAADGALRDLLRGRRALGQPSVITPHPLEAARLLGSSAAEVQADRLGAAQALGAELGVTVVLKGSGSVTVRAGLTPVINSSGNAALATAGSGDVLAGWLGGMWAQLGALPAANADADRVLQALSAAAVYWHGLAGESQAAGPLRSADLVERMHALHTLYAPG